MTKPSFFDLSVWIWNHVLDIKAKQSANFVKRYMLEYKIVHFVCRLSKNEHLNDAKTNNPLLL